jgi:hypothetical protein
MILRKSIAIRRRLSNAFVRTGTNIPNRRAGHITYIFAEPDRVPVGSYSTPPAAKALLRGHVTAATESGECRIHRSLDVKAPHPLALMLRSFSSRQHGVVHVPIVVEQRVVEPFLHPSIVRSRCNA